MFAQLRSGAESHTGVFVYNDHDASLASKQTPPMDILIRYEVDFRQGYKFPPVTFIDTSSFECQSGVLLKHDGVCQFRHIKGLETSNYSISVSRFHAANKNLADRALQSGIHFTTIHVGEGGSVHSMDLPFKDLKQGRTAVLYWISSLALSRAVITQAVFKLVSEAEGILRAPGKTVRSKSNFWLIWYPAPVPTSLSDWLQFLHKGSYDVNDVAWVSPVIEGWYRFTIRDTKEGTNSDNSKTPVRLYFDESSPLTTTSDIDAFVVDLESYATLQIAVPLDISAPDSESSSSATMFDFRTGSTMITPRIVRIDNLLVTGRYGPVRSSRPTTITSWSQRFKKSAKCADKLNIFASSNFLGMRILSPSALDTLTVNTNTESVREAQESASALAKETHETHAAAEPEQETAKNAAALEKQQQDKEQSNEGGEEAAKTDGNAYKSDHEAAVEQEEGKAVSDDGKPSDGSKPSDDAKLSDADFIPPGGSDSDEDDIRKLQEQM